MHSAHDTHTHTHCSVAGGTSPNAGKRVHALWINMREEPVVYINGRPFVLREEVS